MDSIRDELEELEILNYEQKPFITHDALKGLLVESRISTIITSLSGRGQIEVYQQQEVIKAILKNGLRLFATLLSLSRPDLILKFIEADQFTTGQLDSKLPFSKEALGLILKDDKLSARFEKHQWRFISPVFCADQSHRELDGSMRLPFVRCEHLGEGGFGEVYRMFLPASCQGLVPEAKGEVCVVRKQVKPRGDAMSEFQKEQHILSMLRCLSHPNIIKLLAAYTINQTHNFLFPLADGDLKGFFLQKNRPPKLETDNDVFQALHELASAIEAVHGYFSEEFSIRKIGCHYDLKPDNVLYRSGRLILSDFGLSRLSGENDGSNSLYRHGAANYWAPECLSVQDEFKRLPIGRSSDMWSFGCILSEMLTYLQMGPSGVKQYSEKRTIVLASFWTSRTFHGGDKPHEGVAQWLSTLRRSFTDADARNELLIVIQDLLKMTPSERPKAKDVTLDLFHIAQHELYNCIDNAFHLLLAVPDLELQIEYERFQLWGEKTGIKDDLERFRGLRDMIDLHKFAELQMVREGLCELREEIKHFLENSGFGTFRPHYHLRKVIDKFWDMQSASVRLSMMNELENRLLSTDDRTQLKSIEVAFSPAGRSSKDLTPVGPVAYNRIGLLATMKQIASALDDRTKSMEDMRLEEQHIKPPITGFHWHYTGVYQPPDVAASQVLVECLEYDLEKWAGRVEELIQRVQEIVTFRAIPLSSLAFPVLTCAGYYHNLARHVFGIVYNFPCRPVDLLPSIPDVETPVSLRDILSRVRQRSERPSLDQVLAIARRLVSIVVTMHKANWLHKNISSYNIIFLPDRFSSIAESMRSPYFVGFNYSRLNLETAFTQGPDQRLDSQGLGYQQLDYQHPKYQQGGERFRQEFDYYSIGLVLLELGSWTPLKSIIKDIRGNPGQLSEALLKGPVPILRSYMGAAYAEAVAACLGSDFGGSSKPVDVREAFEKKVLQKISKGHV